MSGDLNPASFHSILTFPQPTAMIEVISIPLVKFVLFLAAVFAPSDAAEFEVRSAEFSDTYIRNNQIWLSESDPEQAFTVSAYKLLSSSGLVDFKPEVQGLYDHRWSDKSVLKVGPGIEVLKTEEGLLIFPDGIKGSTEPIEVVYVKKVISRRMTQE